MVKLCKVCGKPFNARGRAKHCSKECSEISIQRNNLERKSYAKEHSKTRNIGKKKRKGDCNKSLVEQNAAARAAGMSYGKYKARLAAAAVKVDLADKL